MDRESSEIDDKNVQDTEQLDDYKNNILTKRKEFPEYALNTDPRLLKKKL